MTYNFDPDRWYEDQRRLLELRRRDGTLDEAAFDEAERKLERRYNSMLARLDGTFRLSGRDKDGRQ
jgi:hypothetical protein